MVAPARSRSLLVCCLGAAVLTASAVSVPAAWAVSVPAASAVSVPAAADPMGRSPNGSDRPASPSSWSVPTCDPIEGGDGSLSYTTDDGTTITPTAARLTPVTYTHVAVLTEPDSLIGISQHLIRRSTDAGCTWHSISKVPERLSAFDIAAGADGVGFVYGINQQPIFVVRGDQVRRADGPVDGDGVVALAADPTDPDRLRAVDAEGQIYRSDDAARSWSTVGHVPAVLGGRAYMAAIDPTDPDHVVVGASGFSAATTDGGATWTRPTGLTEGRNNKRTNMFSVSMSPVDASVVWAEGYDLDRTGQSVRRIWRSTDGGHSFTGVVDGSRVDLVNGTRLYPSPWDTNVLYFAFGMAFGGFGTDLYRLDLSADVPMWQRLSSQHNDYDGIDSIAFHPTDPQVLYLGLSEER